MAKYVIEDTTLTGIADAIRAKTGGTDPIPVTDMAARIAAITGGGSGETLTAILEEQTVEFDEYGQVYLEATTPLVVGETYIVVWNGTEYECEAFSVSPTETITMTMVGNPSEGSGEDNGMPFAIFYATAEITGTTSQYGIMALDGSTSAAVAIYQKTSGGGSVEGIVYVTFMNGNVELCKTACMKGDSTVDPVADGKIAVPTKEPTVDTVYTYAGGWALTDGGEADELALIDVTEDRTVYAAYIEAVRYYTINFYDDDGTTLLESQQLTYGAMPIYTPEKAGFIFMGWDTDVVAVVADASYYAQWEEALDIEDSWEEIIAAVNDGTYSSKYGVGMRKSIDLGSEGVVNMVVAALDTDTRADGTGTAAISWVADKALATTSTWYDSNGVVYSWSADLWCVLRSHLKNDILPLLPTAIQESIVTVTKQQTSAEGSKTIALTSYPTQDAVWVPSEAEITEGGAYAELFTDDNKRIRTKVDTGEACIYWLRDAVGGTTCYTRVVTAAGKIGNSAAANQRGVVIGFCI